MEKENNKLNLISKIHKECPIPYFMTIITFILSTLWFVYILTFKISSRMLITLFTYVPFVLSLIITFISYWVKKSKIPKIIIDFLFAILIGILSVWYLLVIVITGFDYALTPTTDIKDYEKVVTRDLLTVFLEKIPENVQNVSFIDQIGFLQGGSYTTLYYVDPNLDITEFDNKYKEHAIWIGNKQDYTENPGLFIGAFFGTPVQYESEDDFTLYLFKGRCDDSGYCNHGESLLVGVNPKTSEVVYSYGRW